MTVFVMNFSVGMDDGEAGAVVGGIDGEVLIHLTVPPLIALSSGIVLDELDAVASVVAGDDQFSREATTEEL